MSEPRHQGRRVVLTHDGGAQAGAARRRLVAFEREHLEPLGLQEERGARPRYPAAYHYGIEALGHNQRSFSISSMSPGRQ